MALDRELVRIAVAMEDGLQQPVHMHSEAPPPRRVSVAFALALHTQPQFAAILGIPFRSGAEDPGEPPRRMADFVPVPPNEVFERALGLSAWEVDDLREEVDRRAGTVFKRDRTLAWLWSWAAMPATAGSATLGAAMFPGVDVGKVSMIRRGGHLFAMSREVRCPRGALWLPWLADDELGPGLRKRVVEEAEAGLVTDLRVCMRRDLD